MLSCKYHVSNIPVNMGIFLLEKILKLKIELIWILSWCTSSHFTFHFTRLIKLSSWQFSTAVGNDFQPNSLISTPTRNFNTIIQS